MMFKKNTPVIMQKNKYDCGIACLAMLISRHEGYKVDPRKLKEKGNFTGRDGTSLKHLRDLSEEYGYGCKVYKVPNLKEETKNNQLNFPLMVHWEHNHFVLLEKIKGNHATIIDPASGRKKISLEQFYESYAGIAVSITKEAGTSKTEKRLKGDSLVKKIGRYLFQEKKMLVYIVLLSFVFQGLNAVTPFLTQYLIDTFMGNGQDMIQIDVLAALAGITALLFFGLSLLRMFWIIKLQVRINKGLTNQFIKKIFSLPMKFFEVNTSGDIATRIHNIAAIREIISRLASTLILDISLLIVFCIVMLYYSPLLSVLVFVGAALQILFTIILLPKIEMFTKQEVNSQAKFQSQLVELLRSMTFIKTVGNTQSIESQMNHLFDDQIGYFSKRMNTSAVLGGVSNAVNLSLPLFVLVVGVWIGMQNGLTIGAVVAFSTIAGRFMTPLGSIIGSLESVKMVEEMVDRIETVLEEEDEPYNADSNAVFNPSKDKITLNHVFFSYDNGEEVLTDINFDINPGEKVSFIGKTGSGKSTLFKLISGLYQPTKGSIHFGPHHVEDINMIQLREKIGYIVQDVHLFNDTILNNIKYFTEAVSDEDAVQAAKDACIHDFILTLPMGYHTLIGENGISLSGGQRQRIAIARVLAKHPQILLIDEGTSNLDKETEKRILEHLYDKEITIISITHRTDVIQEFESIYELDGGRLKQWKTNDTEELESTS
ncbi:peptidase domain-containing ABC transporter [Salibacterium halotolerans]|uniref:ABC-type bacteriocin/lantibiotic exporter, contains an N-terminal double-glycine peptidase domain n=1 Tax=Salibacterium halotolerans TaxID=1884432 RepID=A0A1I5WSN2_9BACI|nr:peptidase domain-containing ABC transporter [Salibacterium halotolerans]SFQ22792.1 ABC-type bacteriocin/lantibiotic exporter, contains an N-terminal double-glycine peptidase domain [Salibacterium halotolerans]